MMTMKELEELQEGDLVLCLKSEGGVGNISPGFTAGKVYSVGGIYYKRCKAEIYTVIKMLKEYPSYYVWQNLVPIEKDDQGVSNGWKHTNFVSLKNKDLTTVKILYGIE